MGLTALFYEVGGLYYRRNQHREILIQTRPSLRTIAGF